MNANTDALGNISQRPESKQNTNCVLLALLDSKGLKQSDLAKEVGVDRAYINRIIHGTEKPPIQLMIKIAKILEVDSRVVFPRV